MISAIRLSPTRTIRYEIGKEQQVIEYLRSQGMPFALLVQIEIQLGILAAVTQPIETVKLETKPEPPQQDYIGQWPEDWQQRANGSVEPEATPLEKLFFVVSAVATVVLIIWLGGAS